MLMIRYGKFLTPWISSFALIIFLSLPSQAEIITLKDGSKIQGKLISFTETSVYIETPEGKLAFNKDKIESVTQDDGVTLATVPGILPSSATVVENPQAPAKPKASYDREFTIAVWVPRNDIGGDFDGQSGFVGQNFVIVLPDADPAWGIGLSGGIKSRVGEDLAVGIDVAIEAAEHDATFLGSTGKVDSTHVDFDFKLFFQAQKPVQPFLLGGMSLSTINVKEGYISTTGTHDALFTGVGYHLGAGLNWYMSPRVSLNGMIRNRWLTFDQVDYGPEEDLPQDLKAGGLDMALGLAFHFNLGS